MHAELIDDEENIREDVIQAQTHLRDHYSLKVEQMIRRYQQLTNPNEN